MILLFTKVIILNLFSSEILSIMIITPFTFIDSIEDLEKRDDLQPLLFVPDAAIENIQSDPKLKNSMSRALANNQENKLNHDYSELLQGNINRIFDNVSVKHSHVLLTSKSEAEIMISLNKIKYGPITHISRQHYYDMVYGHIFRRYE